ncbi:MAG: hypothetical protein ACRCXM_07655 [Beijerinckiaceae bacterium]
MSKLSSPRLLSTALLAAALTWAAVPPRAALAQTVSIESLSFGGAGSGFKIPKIEIDGSSLSQTEVTQLLGARDPKSVLAGLQKLNARAIRVPEMRLEQTIAFGDGEKMTNTTVYRNFTMNNVVAGKAASIDIAGGTFEGMDAKKGKISGTFGRMAAEEFDVPTMIRFFIEAAGPGDNAMRTVYRNFTFDGMNFKLPENAELVIGRMNVGDAKLRLMRQPLSEFFAFMDANKDKKKLSAAETKQMISMVTGLLDAMETSAATIDGFKVRGLDKNKKPIDVSADRFKVGPYANRVYPAYDIENISIKAPDGFMKIGRAGFKQMDFNGTMKALESAGDGDFEKWAEANWRSLIPAFAGFYIGGLDFDLPDEKNKGQRIKGKLADFDVTLGKYVGGIPTDISSHIKNLAIEIPGNTKEQGLRTLLDLGYKAIDIGANFSTQWDEASKTIKLKSLGIEGVNMGAITSASTFGGAVKELFTGDKNQMQLAALGLTVKDIDIKVVNSGLLDKLIATEAAKGKKTPDQLKKEIAGMAQQLIPAFLGGSDSATAVGRAVAQFAQSPRSLIVNAKAKEPNGISVLEAAMASGNPLALLPKIDISAKAE